MKKTILIATLGVLLLAGAAVFAKPVKNISGKRHPNLAAAQTLVQKAFDKITLAQKANEFDLGGHAQKAKDLLEQANAELKLAAEASNANK